MRRSILVFLLLMALMVWVWCVPKAVETDTENQHERSPLHIMVMDPLALQLACECVPGHAQRRYGRLADFLEERLQRPIKITFTDVLTNPQGDQKEIPHVIVGKHSTVVSDAAKISMSIRRIAALTDRKGSLTLTGLFVVRYKDPAKSMKDLRGYRILFGPDDADEKHAAAMAAMEAFGLHIPAEKRIYSTCNTAAVAVVENEGDAALVSSYAMPLLEGCDAIAKGELRIIGATDPVPFISVFATERLNPRAERQLLNALREVRLDAALLKVMESREGFIEVPAIETRDQWTDWRGGPKRDANRVHIPTKIPSSPKLLWRRTLTGPAMAGPAVTTRYVVVADKSLDNRNDIFRCLDADTGRELWALAYPAAGDMDYTNSPRANPVIYGDRVFLLGALGHLHCVKLDTGKVLWKKNLVKDFDAELPMWGTCATPLIVNDKLIVNPGAKNASLVALDIKTGKVLWQAPGEPAAYSSFILGVFGGVRQIVGYDSVSLGGWDPETGRRLWKLLPREEGDFNVPTPINFGGRILVSTENNGTRLYEFGDHGRVKPLPIATFQNLSPGISTPLLVNGMLFGISDLLMCLDPNNGLKKLWDVEDDVFEEYCTFIGGQGRVLITAKSGKLLLVEARQDKYVLLSSTQLFEDEPETEREIWPHPTLVGNRLYVRNFLGISCFLLE